MEYAPSVTWQQDLLRRVWTRHLRGLGKKGWARCDAGRLAARMQRVPLCDKIAARCARAIAGKSPCGSHAKIQPEGWQKKALTSYDRRSQFRQTSHTGGRLISALFDLYRVPGAKHPLGDGDQIEQ